MTKKKRHTRERAVALRYGESESVPKIVGSGAGVVAKRIVELAKEHDIPVKQNDSLVDILSQLDIGAEIPESTYRIVAEILTFLYRTDDEWRARKVNEKEVFKNASLSDKTNVQSDS